jgi:hypothetical protein
MKTTELFAELLIIGLGALVWIAFLVVTFFGTDPLKQILDGEQISPGFSLLVIISLAYVLGIILDRAYLPLWSAIESYLMRKNGINSVEAYYDFQVKVAGTGSEEVMAFLEYYISRIRILRATTVNFGIIAIVAVFAFKDQCTVVLFLFSSAVILAVTAFAAYYQLGNKYYGFVRRLGKNIVKKKATKTRAGKLE